MILSELQTLVGSLTNDPNHDRYSLADINTELNNTQSQWNQEIKIIKFTATITTIAGTRRYALSSLLTGTPISFPRVTHKGIDLKKRSKSWLDLYTSSDWTQQIGTPTDFFIEDANSQELNNIQYLTVFPTPQSGDAGANLVVEYVVTQTPMSASSDVPFTLTNFTNYLMRPYDFYLAYSAAARLLARDPSPENNGRAAQYLEIAREGKELIVNVFKNLEAEEPLRLRGGRNWVF